jgi:heat-inducible transcriptional repressor
MNMDATTLPELTRRQEEILALIVRAYTQKPEPVSSKYLVDTYNLSFSSATIRNEMAVLEELGYISAPHTSAGRVPTESGYRYFVKRLLTNGELTLAEQNHIAEKFKSTPMVTEQWMRAAATVLARTVQSASIVTAPKAQTNRFKHLELIAIQGRLVLLVLVLHGGTVHQRMLTLAEPISQPGLSEMATRINSLCADLLASEIRIKGTQLPILDREILDLVVELIDKADSNQAITVYREGLSDIISLFPGNEGAQQAVRVLEEFSFLNMILNEFLNDSVRVVIAGEGRWEELSQLSMVLSRYGIPGQASGAVGVVGPTHINYGRAISTVRYVSSVMTSMLVNLYQNPAELLPNKTNE